MNKTTPEEAEALADKHDFEACFGQGYIGLAALIDEVRAERALEYVSLFGELQSALEKTDEVRGVDAEPVEFQYRMRPTWEPVGKGWSEWGKCSPESYEDYARLPLHNGWQYEARKLYTHPAPSQPAAPVELPVVVGAMYLDREEGWMPVKNGEVDDRFTPLIDSPGLPPLAAGWEWTRVAKVIYLSGSAKEPS